MKNVCLLMLSACVLLSACVPQNPSLGPVYGPRPLAEGQRWYGEDGNATQADDEDPFDVCAAERAELEARLRKEIKPKIIRIPPKHKLDDLMVVGRKEYVYLSEVGLKLPAKVDTGATTSSLSATDIQRYERDGEKWVRFTITDSVSGESVEVERPQVRRVRIKQHVGEGQSRFSVEMWVRVGSVKCRTEFTLTDRSEFNMPVLLGRSFLHGKAVVDVTREYTTSPLNDADEQ